LVDREQGPVDRAPHSATLGRCEPRQRQGGSRSSAWAHNEYIGQGKEKAEYHNIVTWDRLAQTCGEFLGKGQQVAVEGRIQTRSWDDDRGVR
jgi:single-stranded DNA-binding protein